MIMTADGSTWLRLVPAVVILITSCTSFRAVGPAESAWTRLKPGDEVHVVTKDSRDYQFVVTAVDATSLSGDQVKLSWSDIATVAIKRIDVGKTLVSGIYGLGTTLVVILGLGLMLLFAL